MPAGKHCEVQSHACRTHQDTAEFRVHKAARMASGTVSREPYQTGFCQESTVTVDNLLSPSWDFQKDVDEAAGP